MVDPNKGDNENPLDDSEHGQIEALKGELKLLNETIAKMSDSIKQTTLTQNQLARAALTAKEIADSAMAELTKTKSELAAALTEMQKKVGEGLSVAIQQTMKGFVDEISKKTDEKIVVALGQQGGQPSQDGHGQQAMARQGGGLDIIGQLLQNIEPITKLIAAWKAPVPNAGTMAADQVVQGFKIAKLFNNLEVAKTDVATFAKIAHEALDITPKV